MKRLIEITIVSVFILYIAPAVAFDKGGSDKRPVTFQAFKNMSAVERQVLTPLTETELTSIEGAYLEVPVAAIQQWTIVLAILEALRGNLGCTDNCMAQTVTQRAPVLNGANIAFVYQTPSPNGSLTTPNVSTIQQRLGVQ